jgi:serine protease Do
MRNLALLLTALLAGAQAAAADQQQQTQPSHQAEAPPAAASPVVASFAPMVKRVAPSVVTVFSSRTLHADQAVPPWMEDDPILGHLFGTAPRGGEQKQRGLGSGVVVRTDGYILTNNHVVEEADEVKVGFAEGAEQYVAKVVGTDPKTDLAVLKIDAGSKQLVPIEFGDSAKVEVGDLVFAIGNPFGVGQTVTMGIVSAVGRGVGIADYEDFLQTDASINPGNSGGPLVDTNGRLVGVNTAIISPTGANLGIGFAVPASLAKGVMESIIAKGKVIRGYLGVVIQPLTPELAKAMELPSDSGALVGDVQDDSPAQKAGLQAGDVITGVNGAKVDDARHLRLMIAQLQPGTKITLSALRDGKEKSFDATLQDLADSAVADRGGRKSPRHQQRQSHSGGELGIRLDELGDDTRRAFHIPSEIKGAVITEVRPGSKAEDSGVKPGMVVVAVGKTPVSSPEDAASAIDEQKGDVLLRVWQDGGRLYLVIHR